MITLPREERHKCQVTDLDDGQLECEFSVYLEADERPEIKLRKATFESSPGEFGGVETVDAADHKKFLDVHRSGFAHNKCWAFLQLDVAREYWSGQTVILEEAA